MIHITKNIYYNDKSYLLISKTQFKKHKYTLITVEIPQNKPNSLVFSINHGITTPGIKHELSRDSEIKKEMDVIVTVLNRLFDEHNEEYYIGNNNLTHIHNSTNLVLNSMNKHNTYFIRKNKNTRMGPIESSEPFTINSISKLDRKKSFRARREGRRRGRLTRKSNKINKKSTIFNNTEPLSQNNISEA